MCITILRSHATLFVRLHNVCLKTHTSYFVVFWIVPDFLVRCFHGRLRGTPVPPLNLRPRCTLRGSDRVCIALMQNDVDLRRQKRVADCVSLMFLFSLCTRCLSTLQDFLEQESRLMEEECTPSRMTFMNANRKLLKRVLRLRIIVKKNEPVHSIAAVLCIPWRVYTYEYVAYRVYGGLLQCLACGLIAPVY